jgi:hypothetical protein
VVLILAATAKAQAPFVLINEILSDPGSMGFPSSDTRDEYIELRGTPGLSLDNMFLIFVENENNIAGTGNAGKIDNIFFLGDDPTTPAVETPYQLGSNGFLVMRQKGSLYTDIAPGTTVITNTFVDPMDPFAGEGWGSRTRSTIRASDDFDEGKIENGGYTAMLVQNLSDPLGHWPAINMDLDAVGGVNNGLDFLDTSGPHWEINDPMTGMHWRILDSIGVTTEFDEDFSRLYGKVNFGALPGATIEAPETGATFAHADMEIEYLGRWGNSTGQTIDDWHISNLTLHAGSGSAGLFAAGGPDWRQSCIDGAGCPPAPDPDDPPPLGIPVESTMGVPYGTQLTTTLGAPNFISGDYNKDGRVTAADYSVWRNSLGQTGSHAADLPADGNHDYEINLADYQVWKANYGDPASYAAGAGAILTGGGVASGNQVPEPTSAGLSVLAVAGVLVLCKLRIRLG